MITSSNRSYKLSESHQKDKFVIAGGKEVLVADSRGKVYPMGGVPPKSAPSAKAITGGGELTPGVGYSYAYSYLNPYQDCETAPSHASAYIGNSDSGSFKTIRFGDDGKTVYISGEDLEKGDDYYNGHTLACEIVNNEYTSVYSEWQYRSVTDYWYDSTNDYGVFMVNRPFFNVDPDEDDQKYTVKIDDLETEEGIVGGKSKGKSKLVLDPSASQLPSDYRFKTIHITQGRGKGQKRIIMDAILREDGLIEITVDAPWKEKPKFVDNEKKDLYALREKAEGQKGANRKPNFYKQFYSSEYVICDPLRYNGLAIDANVIEYNNKSKRVKLSGLGHSDDLLTGSVLSYTDRKGAKNDFVTVSLPSDTFSSSSSSDFSIDTFQNKRFRIFDGPGAGLDCLISDVDKATGSSITLVLSTFGKLKKKNRPNASSKFVIYSGSSLSSSETSDGKTSYPTIRKAVPVESIPSNKTNLYKLYCCATDVPTDDRDSDYLCSNEAANVDSYNSGRCYVMFQVFPSSKDSSKAYYITRPIVGAEAVKDEREGTDGLTYVYSRLVLTISDLPSDVTILTGAPYFVHSDSLQDGLYTGWIAAFYNTSDSQSKGQKKVRTSRVAGYLDATGEILLCNAVPGIGEGWQCVLYSEYTRQFGSRVFTHLEDTVDPSYSSNLNSRFFHLDYFASGEDAFYNGWSFEFLYGTAKKVKGKNLYTQLKNKRAYTVSDYRGQHRIIDVGEDLRMNPVPVGDEFVTLYDPSSYIFKVFSSDDAEANSQDDGTNSSSDGIKMLVSGIVKSNVPGFDKIRLYRASDSTETYRLCATLENKTQTYIDNASESELSTELDFAHSSPTPAKYVASRNSVFALAGSASGASSVSLFKNAFVGLEDTSSADSFLKEGLTYVHGDFTGTVLKSSPLIGLNLGSDSKLVLPLPSDKISSDMLLTLALDPPTQDGFICSSEKLLSQSTIRSELFPYSGSEELTPESPDVSQNVSYFFLALDSDSDLKSTTLYLSDADGVTHSLVFDTDFSYDSSSKKVTLKNQSIKLNASISVLGTEYDFNEFSSGSGRNKKTKKALTSTPVCRYVYKPVSYSIYRSSWSLSFRSSNFYFSSFGSEKLLPSSPFCGSSVILSCALPQVAGNDRQSICFGGEIKSLLNGPSVSFCLYYASLSKAEIYDSTISSYSMASLAFTDKWDRKVRGDSLTTSSTKAFANVPANESGSPSAQLFVRHANEEPVVTASQLRHFVPGYNLICFAQGNTNGASLSSMRVRDVDLEVQITSPYEGQREKVELSNVYNLNDGFGTKITGIISTSQGFVVFKDRGVYLIVPEAHILHCISHEFGCVAPGSLTEGKHGFYWLSDGGYIMRQAFTGEDTLSCINKALLPWFHGEESLYGHSIDFSRIESECHGTYDCDLDDFIISIPCKKDGHDSTVILAYNETFDQWWRLDDGQSGNSVNCAFRFEGHAAFAGFNGIYDFTPDRSYINPWRYESRWRDEGSSDKLKHVKRIRINNRVVPSVSSDSEADFVFYKDQISTPEPNHLTYGPGSHVHKFYTNQARSQVTVGTRAYEWKFLMSGSGYLNVRGLVLEYRRKDDTEDILSNSPPDSNNS